ncbi:alpha/beta fold hydrolase [Spongiivirga citrea]|uniref:Alpha/beta fold hydrolase n=1 Tax=Spongiivirga citrea TaxID=1481457 RepID=A0A6M0CLX6_9FLAO|nr:alpha/beta hydrolase [Spongiivirga citrea]NER18891.1 alpha/beta fold hydrolase [Spongiivirga citrea]
MAFPQIKKLRPHEVEVLSKSDQQIVNFNGIALKTYRYPNSGPKIFLVHGWEGHGGNFSDIIEKLVLKNYHIFTFDAPSHGSSSASKNSIFDFPESVQFLLEKERPDHIVSHSFGAVATTFALNNKPEISIKKYVLLSNPDRFIDRINFVAEQAGITERLKNKLIKKVANETGQDLKLLSVSNFVQNVSVEKALIIHDKNDKIQPQRDPENVNKVWDISSLEIIEGTGHFRMLRTQFVIDRIIIFIQE